MWQAFDGLSRSEGLQATPHREGGGVNRLPALLLLAACSGQVAERPKEIVGSSSPSFALAATAPIADSASICWQRFSRGVSVEASCTGLTVSPRVDTVRIPVAPDVVSRGIPFGPHDLWTSPSKPLWGPAPFTASLNADGPDGIVARIAAARALKHRLFLAMTSGNRTRYLTNGTFDLQKWKDRQNLFATPEIVAAVKAGVLDGTVVGANFMDEPQATVDGKPAWGRFLSKAELDQMASYVKGIYGPALPVGLSVRADYKPLERFGVVDFIFAQYIAAYGPIAKWRDSTLALARQNGVAVVLAINITNGGAGFNETSCPSGFGDPGRCRMSPDQVRAFGSSLASWGCGLILWRFDSTAVAKPENVAALKDLGRITSLLPSITCKRS
jgi:hypothetical protein